MSANEAMIAEHVKAVLAELAAGNGYGEPVTLVAAVKTRTPAEIQCAIDAGITAVGENKVQEFRDKYDKIIGAERHFIGHLQTNKAKYLVGRTHLIHSLDRDELAAELSALAVRRETVQDVLIQINIGDEASKGGYPLSDGLAAFERAAKTAGLRPRGFMAMLPLSDDASVLAPLADAMRRLFEAARPMGAEFLSMGMSGDYKLCLAHGANMIRIGTSLFGNRPA